MANEPREPSILREEWMAMLFVGVIILAVVAVGVMLLFGL